MTGYEITQVFVDYPGQWCVVVFSDDDTDRTRGHSLSIPHDAIHNRMAVHSLASPADAFEHLVYETLWLGLRPKDPRDDPALVGGWVTGTGPDAEMITLYTAVSGADAAGASMTRVAACRAQATIRGFDDHRPNIPADPARVQFHRELVDTMRWVQLYGALPQPSRSSRLRGIPLEASRA